MTQQLEIVEAKGTIVKPEQPPLDGMSITPHEWLIHILRQPRSHNSSGDIAIRQWIVDKLKSMKVTYSILAGGNIVASIGKNATLFSCHTDTVHSHQESNSTQAIIFDPAFNHIFLDDKSKTCLGADDGAGIYVMLRMIEAKVKGTYVFHVGEERGGIGAREMLRTEKTFLQQFKRAVAFDRAGNTEVIITQGGQPCASSVAGQDIADRLNEHGLKYELSTRGVFTDTKVYADVIPECFNLGVGYMNQHTRDEYLDVEHVEALITAVCDMDWEAIRTTRVIQPKPTYVPKPTRGFVDAGEFKGLSDLGKYNAAMNGRSRPEPEPEDDYAVAPVLTNGIEDVMDLSRDELEALIEDDPATALLAMIELIGEVKSLQTRVETLRGFL